MEQNRQNQRQAERKHIDSVADEMDLSTIESLEDPKALEIASETPEGVHPYYHTIGKLGGNAVKDKYARFGKDNKLS